MSVRSYPLKDRPPGRGLTEHRPGDRFAEFIVGNLTPAGAITEIL